MLSVEDLDVRRENGLRPGGLQRSPERSTEIRDDTRIRASLPTINYLLGQGAPSSSWPPISAGRRENPIRP